jgi:endonuclease/exonuclease/phosphatase family metal-dependent hydrolase
MHSHLSISTIFFAVASVAFPAAEESRLRVATFNVSFNSDQLSRDGDTANPGALVDCLKSADHPSLRKIAEVLQRVKPDIVLLNEFDLAYRGQEFDRAGTQQRVDDFRRLYLEVAQAEGLVPLKLEHSFIAPTNTGVHSGQDLNRDGIIKSAHDGSKADSQAYGGDAFGFGQYPGKYGMVLLSRHPFDMKRVRTFQTFRWRDMPGALLPEDPQDSDGNGDRKSLYSEAVLEVFRLSSKSHWDVPVLVEGQTIHVLCAHPTPPSFDDGTTTAHSLKTQSPATHADWNGLRNHDEIRLLADYIDPARSGYLYDDAGERGGLEAGARFVIVGDLNADPVDGSSAFGAIRQLLEHPLINADLTPRSDGAEEQVRREMQRRETKTARFNMRADYVLPSRAGLVTIQSGVFWPTRSDPLYPLLEASDHRCVWVDMEW